MLNIKFPELYEILYTQYFLTSYKQFDYSTTEKGLQDVHLNAEFFGKVVGSRGTLLDWKLMEVGTMKMCCTTHVYMNKMLIV